MPNETIFPLPALPPNASSYTDIRTMLAQELPAVQTREQLSHFVHAGGLHGTSVSLVSPAFATEAFTKSGNRVTANGAGGAAAINYAQVGAASTDTAWVIISAQSGSTLPGTNFVRAGASNYFVDAVSPTAPPLPDDSAYLMRVTISGGAITAVKDMRKPASYVYSGVFDVTDPLYGAIGDGVTTVQAGQRNLDAIKAAFSAGTNIFFPQGIYYCGTNPLINLKGMGAGISIETRGFVSLVCNTPPNTQTTFFHLDDNSDFHCGPIAFVDQGGDPSVVFQGAVAFYLNNDTPTLWGNLTFDNIACTGMVAAVFTQASAPFQAFNRINGIHISQLALNGCYYGIRFENDGDALTIDNLTAFSCVQPYYVAGCAGHTITRLFTRRNRPSTGRITIARTSPVGRPTRSIAINYTSREDGVETSGDTHVLIAHNDLLGGEISNIELNIAINGTLAPYIPLRAVNYTGPGGVESGAASSNVVNDIIVRGSCDTNAQNMSVTAQYPVRQHMQVAIGANFAPDFLTRTRFIFSDAQSRAVVSGLIWSTPGVPAPVLGNGTLDYSIDIQGGHAVLTGRLIWGSTTTGGNGLWAIGNFLVGGGALFPSFQMLGQALFFDASATTWRTGVCLMAPGNNFLQFYANNTTAEVSATVPQTWAAGDELFWSITIPYTGS